jgi:uncharacterized protein YacL
VTIIFIRIFFVLISILIGYQLGGAITIFGKFGPLIGAATGFVGAILLILLEMGIRKVSVRGLSASVFGLIFGLVMAKVLTDAFVLLPIGDAMRAGLKVIFTAIFCYLGMVIAMRGKDEFNLIIPYVKLSRQDRGDEVFILDTSVIIDGRIADLCQTKFIEGRFVIPRFVLRELQQIADSSDSLKRNRGRRGLEMLNKIQKNFSADVRIHEEDFPEILEVDAKLVRLAKVLGAKVFTNDYNLNRVAEIQGVKVLNINELANALKPVVLPGEILEVRLVKEGKEFSQAVGYLDDGTMVVVENARHLIGQNVKSTVTSVLQTSAGRMIFAKI